MPDFPQIDRRSWLGTSAGLLLTAAHNTTWGASVKRPKVAAILTEFTYRSHAHVILENFLKPYYFNGQRTTPGVDVVSFYVDQTPAGRDMSRAASKDFDIPIYADIAKALCLGGQELAVDAVLSIGEHGNYPVNDRGQRMYPRKRFFDEIVEVFRTSGRVVPVFNDKHLSYRWDWAEQMMQTVNDHQIPFMAGSSVPLATRRPPLELPRDASIKEAISIHGGPLESYDFHALEVLQSLIEGRRGGETGIQTIQLLEGPAVWEAAEQGRWSVELASAAMKAEPGGEALDLRGETMHAILLTYRDGLRATILRVGRSSTRWNFACRLQDRADIQSTSFYVGPWENRNLFKALSHAIQVFFREGEAPYPVERTHLVTGALAAAMDSRFQDHAQISTPQLAIAYAPKDFRAMREMGRTWELITESTPQPQGIDPGGPR